MPHGSIGNPLGLAWWNQSGALYLDGLSVEYTQGDSARLHLDGLVSEAAFSDTARLYLDGLVSEGAFYASGQYYTGSLTGSFYFSPTVGPKIFMVNRSVNNLQYGNSGDFGTFRLDTTDTEYLTIPRGNEEGIMDFGSGDFTMEAWLKIESTYDQTWCHIISTQASHVENDTLLGLSLIRGTAGSTSSDSLAFMYNNADWSHYDDHRTYSGVYAAAGNQHDTWVHCAATVKDNQLRLFLNGIMQRQGNSSGPFTYDMQTSPDSSPDSAWSGEYMYGGVSNAIGESSFNSNLRKRMPIGIGRLPGNQTYSNGTYLTNYSATDTTIGPIRITTGVARYTGDFNDTPYMQSGIQGIPDWYTVDFDNEPKTNTNTRWTYTTSTAPNYASILNGSHSINIWYKRTADSSSSPGNNQYLYAQGGSNSHDLMYVFFTSTKLKWNIKQGGVSNSTTFNFSRTVGQWDMLTFVWDNSSTQATVYRNGVAIISPQTWTNINMNNYDTTQGGNPSLGGGGRFFFGSAANYSTRAGSIIDGEIAQVAFFDAALGSTQIASMYNQGERADLSSESDIVNYWRYGNGTENGAGGTIYDMVGSDDLTNQDSSYLLYPGRDSGPVGFPIGSADPYYSDVSFLLNGNEL